jgi:hypothetical protein
MTAIRTASACAVAAGSALIGCPGTAAADTAAACRTGDVEVIGAQPMSPGSGHRGARIFFTLASGGAPCTLKGYPGVDTYGGEPVVHAQRTQSGYLGGLHPNVVTLPTVLLDGTHLGMAEVEWMVADQTGNSCPGYPGVLVWAPDTTKDFSVPITIDSPCNLQVHPVTEPDVTPEPDIPAS